MTLFAAATPLSHIEETDAAKFICPKKLWRMRCIAAENSFGIILFQSATARLTTMFNVDIQKTAHRFDPFSIQYVPRGRISIFFIDKWLLTRKYNPKLTTEHINPSQCL
jgi:hypothetical protein